MSTPRIVPLPRRSRDADSWLTTGDLAERWKCSLETVRRIPRAELPYMTLSDKPQAHRFYRMDKVLQYEDKRMENG